MPYSSNFQSGGPLDNTPECRAKYSKNIKRDAKDSAILLAATVALIPLTGGLTALFLPFVSINCLNQCVEALTFDPKATP